jgi:hypothetical protein
VLVYSFQGFSSTTSKRTWSSREKGWHFLKVLSVRSRVRKLVQELVKLLDKPVSNGSGMVKSLLGALGSVLTALFDACTASSWSLNSGGINNGGVGGARWSRVSDDPFQARSSSTWTASNVGRSPFAADAVPKSELQNKRTAKTESNAGNPKPEGGSLELANEQEASRQVLSFCFLREPVLDRGEASWCDIANPCTSPGLNLRSTTESGPMITFWCFFDNAVIICTVTLGFCKT